jgi:hypothetical protein
LAEVNKNQLCDVDEPSRVIPNPIETGIEDLSMYDHFQMAAAEAAKWSTKKDNKQ